jgi:methylenetetrahydrofolate--tRNA-(uracil-5-)-methyltransferase
MAIISDELREVRDQFAVPRRTEIVDWSGDMEDEDLIEREDMVVTSPGRLHQAHAAGRVPRPEARRQGPVGRRTPRKTTSSRRCSWPTPTRRCCSSPPTAWSTSSRPGAAAGRAHLARQGDRQHPADPRGVGIAAIMPVDRDEADWDDLQIVFATSAGDVRRNALSRFHQRHAQRQDRDEAARGRQPGERAHLLRGRRRHAGHRRGPRDPLPTTDVRVFKGRDSTGVRGIRLAEGDRVVSMAVIRHFEATPRSAPPISRCAALMAGSPTRTEADATTRRRSSRRRFLSQERYAEMSAAEDLILTITEGGGTGKLSLEPRLPGARARRPGRAAMDKAMRGGPAGGLLPGRDGRPDHARHLHRPVDPCARSTASPSARAPPAASRCSTPARARGSAAAWPGPRPPGRPPNGRPVVIHEMRPKVGTFAHQTGDLAEMVCSNSFRSDDDEQNAVGLLHWEMRAAGGLIMEMADAHRLPAGGALAVDRDPLPRPSPRGCAPIPMSPSSRARSPPCPRRPLDHRHRPADLGRAGRGDRAETGPRRWPSSTPSPPSSMPTASTCPRPGCSRATTRARPRKSAPPISTARWTATSTRPSSTRCWPPTRPSSRRARPGYFDGCLPIEVMAERGRETLRHGPMKPVGLTNPHAPDVKPHAVVQLRRDNALGTLYNIVGFQTKMKYGAQTDVFRMIPGLEDASLRPAGRHPPQHLPQLAHAARRPDAPEIAAAYPLRRPDHRRRGLCRKRRHGPAGRAHGRGRDLGQPCPRAATTAMGALVHPHHRRGRGQDLPADERQFRPLPPVDGLKGGRRNRRDRYKAYTDRAKADWHRLAGWRRGAGRPLPRPHRAAPRFRLRHRPLGAGAGGRASPRSTARIITLEMLEKAADKRRLPQALALRCRRRARPRGTPPSPRSA